jgi:1,4-alpha-glucan branching enzyme
MPTTKSKKETFYFTAPGARSVRLVGDFTNWDEGAIDLKKQPSGIWKTTVALDPGTHEYRFIVDGEWCDDPDATMRVKNAFATENCVRMVEPEVAALAPRRPARKAATQAAK